MKNLIIIVLSLWLFLLYKKKHEANEAAASGNDSLQAGKKVISGSATAGVNISGDTTGVLGAPVPLIAKSTRQGIYSRTTVTGNPADPQGAQNVAMDIPNAEAGVFAVGDDVKLWNSGLYPLYYRIISLDQVDSNTTRMVLNTLFVGVEDDIYPVAAKYNTSGFSGTTVTKSAFL